MQLKQVLSEIATLNSSNSSEWQYVAHIVVRLGNYDQHILLLPLGEDRYSLEVTIWCADTRRQTVTAKSMPQWLRNLPDDWTVWRWLPNEERRIFQPAMETMISETERTGQAAFIS